MMLARVADSLYWLGRYAERAEHFSRLAVVMLGATVDRTDAAEQAARIALSAAGAAPQRWDGDALDAAAILAFGRGGGASTVASLARARENARQVRDQITTEAWERLNLLYLRATGLAAEQAFAVDAPEFLQRIIADLHQFTGAAEATMSHGDGWRFMLTGIHIERAQLIARLLAACFADDAEPNTEDHVALVSLLRMACALEPYLRVYTADINSRNILEFLMFNEDFPRSIRFSTGRMHDHLGHLSRSRPGGHSDAARLAGRLNARLTYADIEEIANGGAGELMRAVSAECASIHAAIFETFVAYPLETRLPA